MHFVMHTVVMIGTLKRKRKTMTDEQMMEILDRIDYLFQDFIMISSVVFAVSIKHLKANLTDKDFVAIIDEIRNTDINELIIDAKEEVKKKRTIH